MNIVTMEAVVVGAPLLVDATMVFSLLLVGVFCPLVEPIHLAAALVVASLPVALLVHQG